jgi:hypothetical protein
MVRMPGIRIGWYRRLQMAQLSEGFSVPLFGCLSGPAALIAPMSQGMASATIGASPARFIGISLKCRSWYFPRVDLVLLYRVRKLLP